MTTVARSGVAQPRRRDDLLQPDLLRWIDEPSGDRGVNFAVDDGWEWSGYDELARQARSVAAQVREQTPQGGVVCLVLPTGPEFLASFFGVLWAGRTPCPIAPPNPLRPRERHSAHVASIIGAAGARLVLASLGLHDAVRGAMEEAGISAHIEAPVRNGDESLPRQPASPLALLQFTSGSTGVARGVRVTPENLAANLRDIYRWNEMERSEELATWLPLFHDMGLIGLLILPVTFGMGLRVLSPERFIRDPGRWLECFGRLGSSITAAPSFGYGYAARRVKDAALEGTDFSAWRIAICGSERVDAGALNALRERLEPFGFKASSYVPAYGLAEGTLAVAGVAARATPTVARIDWSSLDVGAPVGVRERGGLVSDAADGDPGWLVGCGRPIGATSVDIADDDGMPLAEGEFGEIAVRGPSVADGYAGDARGGSTRFDEGTLRTGDAGFLLDGELFVIGRLGDSVSVRGRTIFAEDLEARLAASVELAPRRLAVLAGVHDSTELVVVLAEMPPGDWSDDAARLLTAHLGRDVRLQICSVTRGTVEHTTSGKPRRRAMWNAVTNGTMPVERVWESGRVPAPPSGDGAR